MKKVILISFMLILTKSSLFSQVFEPMSLDDYMKPVIAYQRAYNQIKSQIDELNEKIIEVLGKDIDETLRKELNEDYVYLGYLSDRLNNNGISTELRSELNGLKKKYENQIVSYNNRIAEKKKKETEEQKKKETQAKQQEQEPTEWTGTGFALSNLYIVTNYHIVDGARSILVYGVNGQMNRGLNATVVGTDKFNDLAILRISDPNFTGFGNIPYAIKKQVVDVGENVWVLGYPLTQYLGNEIKLTNGIISSKSGFKGDAASYQISAPVQPGNSGGPMFDSKGNVIGIINAGVPTADNVGYAIKSTYLFSLTENCFISSYIPINNTISSLTLKDQVKKAKDYVFLLKCSSKANISRSTYDLSSSSTSVSSNTSSSLSSSSLYGSNDSSTSSSSSHSGSFSSTTNTTTTHYTDSDNKPIMVDLGLSVKWADRNIGASASTDIGDYYAWGETSPKSEFNRDNYEWFKNNQYTNPGGLLDIAESSFDPAHIKYGNTWRMPTEAEIEELITKCTWTWTTSNGVYGYKVTSRNGKSIFLPTNGIKEENNLLGRYWSSETSPIAAYYSYVLSFEKEEKICSNCLKESFGCIRPVSGEKKLPSSSHKKADETLAIANRQYSQGDLQGAYLSARNSIQIKPTAPAHYLRGYLALYYSNDIDVAKESFLFCLKNDYLKNQSLYSYALTLSNNGEYEEAIRQYEMFINEYQTKDSNYLQAWYNKIDCYLELKDLSRCITEYLQLLEYEGKIPFDYALVYNNLAFVYLELNQLNKAIDPIQKAIKLNHNRGLIWDTHGEIHYKVEDYEQCIISMTNAIAIDKVERGTRIDNAYFYRGMAKVKNGNIAGGYVDLEKASEMGNTKAAEKLQEFDAAIIDFSNSGTFKHIKDKDITSSYSGNDTRIIRTELSEESTILYLQYTNNKYEDGWYAIDPNSYIRDKTTGRKYLLLTAYNCALSPQRTSIKIGETVTFALVFPALPEGVSKIDFVESEDSRWKFYNIEL